MVRYVIVVIGYALVLFILEFYNSSGYIYQLPSCITIGAESSTKPSSGIRYNCDNCFDVIFIILEYLGRSRQGPSVCSLLIVIITIKSIGPDSVLRMRYLVILYI